MEAVPDPADAADAVAADENDDAEAAADFIDVINASLTEFMAKAQNEADAAAEAAAKKREELEAAEAEAEQKSERMGQLRGQAQSLADDEAWQSMYNRLRAWSEEKGHCNPRRNWKAKIDAEEKGSCYLHLFIYIIVRGMGEVFSGVS